MKCSNENTLYHRDTGTQSTQGTTYFFPNETQLRITWISILESLLKNDRTTWLHELSAENNEALCELCRRLLDEVHRLNDPNTTSKDAVRLSLACVSLLFLLDVNEELDISDKWKAVCSTTNLMENVVRMTISILGSVSPSGPRWTYEHKDTATIRWAENVLLTRKMCKGNNSCKSVFDLTDRLWRPPLESFLRMLLENDGNNGVGDGTKHSSVGNKIMVSFSRLHLLFSVHHSSVRGMIAAVLSQSCSDGTGGITAEPCRRLISSLMHWSQNVSFNYF